MGHRGVKGAGGCRRLTHCTRCLTAELPKWATILLLQSFTRHTGGAAYRMRGRRRLWTIQSQRCLCTRESTDLAYYHSTSGGVAGRPGRGFRKELPIFKIHQIVNCLLIMYGKKGYLLQKLKSRWICRFGTEERCYRLIYGFKACQGIQTYNKPAR